MTKKILRALCGALLVPSMMVSGAAVGTTAQRYRFPVYVEGQPIVCVNANQKRVPILVYRDTTYIPLRTAGEWAGKNVSWDGGTKTASLSGSVAPRFYNGYDTLDMPSDVPETGTAGAQLLPDMKIVIDGKVQAFKNARGEAVSPLIYHDTAYLPLRNIGEIAGMEVTWVSPAQDIQMIYLRTPLTDGQKAEVREYLAQQSGLANTLMQAATALSRSTDNTQGQIDTVRDTLRRMQEIEPPAAKSAAFFAGRYAAGVQDMAGLAEGMTTANASAAGGELRNETVATYSWLVQLSSVLEQTGSASSDLALKIP